MNILYKSFLEATMNKACSSLYVDMFSSVLDAQDGVAES